MTVFLVVCMLPAGNTLWEEKCDQSAPLTECGWTELRALETDDFRMTNGILSLTCTHKPYRGSLYRHEVPFVKGKGEFTFELRIMPQGRFNHFSLQLNIFNIRTAFNGGNKLICCPEHFATPFTWPAPLGCKPGPLPPSCTARTPRSCIRVPPRFSTGIPNAVSRTNHRHSIGNFITTC